LCDNPDSVYSGALPNPTLPRLAVRIAQESSLISGRQFKEYQALTRTKQKAAMRRSMTADCEMLLCFVAAGAALKDC
jgi:hypothetical protein